MKDTSFHPADQPNECLVTLFFPRADAIAVVKKVRDGFVGDVFPDPAFAHIADEICGEIIASLKKLSAPSGSRDVFGEYDRFEEVVP